MKQRIYRAGCVICFFILVLILQVKDPVLLPTIQQFIFQGTQLGADAQNDLGNIYRDGENVPQDYSKAFEWYSKAANQGLAEAQFSLGFMYENGEGISQDYSKAFEWYSKAADQGIAEAKK